MKAAWYSALGPAAAVLQYGDLPKPNIGADDVLVEIAFSGANPSDVKARGGARPGVTKPQFDRIIPHSDGSGIITEVGSNIDLSRIGQRVWIWNGQWQRPFGTAAEFIALPSEQAVEMPQEMSFETGATLGIPGLTAAHCCFAHGSLKQKTVLISGGAGAVGNLAIQLAKWDGAFVIATASAHNQDRVSKAGADVVLSYDDPDLAEQILQHAPNGIDYAIEVEFGTNAPLLAEVMKANSYIMTYGSALDMAPTLPFGPFLFKALIIDIALIYILDLAQRHKAIECLHLAHAQGAMMSDIHAVFDLSEIALAHQTIEAGKRSGAILLKP